MYSHIAIQRRMDVYAHILHREHRVCLRILYMHLSSTMNSSLEQWCWIKLSIILKCRIYIIYTWAQKSFWMPFERIYLSRCHRKQNYLIAFGNDNELYQWQQGFLQLTPADVRTYIHIPTETAAQIAQNSVFSRFSNSLASISFVWSRLVSLLYSDIMNKFN